MRVNAVAPGHVLTPMLTKSLEIGSVTPETIEARTNRIPMGRYAQAEEIAAAILFLCSPAASYITGETLCVDGAITVNADAPVDAQAFRPLATRDQAVRIVEVLALAIQGGVDERPEARLLGQGLHAAVRDHGLAQRVGELVDAGAGTPHSIGTSCPSAPKTCEWTCANMCGENATPARWQASIIGARA